MGVFTCIFHLRVNRYVIYECPLHCVVRTLCCRSMIAPNQTSHRWVCCLFVMSIFRLRHHFDDHIFLCLLRRLFVLVFISRLSFAKSMPLSHTSFTHRNMERLLLFYCLAFDLAKSFWMVSTFCADEYRGNRFGMHLFLQLFSFCSLLNVWFYPLGSSPMPESNITVTSWILYGPYLSGLCFLFCLV